VSKAVRAAARKPRATGVQKGRPDGSIKLTETIEDTIVTYIEAGAADYIAAEAAGISARTFRDYVSRGTGEHRSRSCTPRLARFSQRVMEAKARARAAREIQAAEHHVPFWLTHMARSKPGREGWTSPVDEAGDGEDGAAAYVPSPEEAAETLRALIDAGVLSTTCSDPDCHCPSHGEAPDERS